MITYGLTKTHDFNEQFKQDSDLNPKPNMDPLVGTYPSMSLAIKKSVQV